MENLIRAAGHFGLDPLPEDVKDFGTGLIHDTYHVASSRGDHLVQRVNTKVFPDAALMVENAAAAARRVHESLVRSGCNDPRQHLKFLTGQDQRPWHRDDSGAVWRAMEFIPDSRPADTHDPAEIRSAARALGRFPGLVAGGSGREPVTVLAGFHDTPARLRSLVSAAASDHAGRQSKCRGEIDRLLGLEFLANRICGADLPERFVHNDAKLDNVLVDTSTGEALCVIDLDTVMPGKAPHDFGDLVRSAVTGRPEDEPDLDRISVPEETFADLGEGYLEGADDWIGEAEKSLLYDGALTITYEQALRFLADYLEGDVYYRTADPEHNLRRARAQIRLLDELLKAEPGLRKRLELI